MVSNYIIEENTKRIANGFWILGIILLFLVPVSQAAPPVTSYWGYVTVDGITTSNALVKVLNSTCGEEAATISVDGGLYQITVPWEDALFNQRGVKAGETITFLVDGKFATSRVIDAKGTNNKLNLSILSSAPTYVCKTNGVEIRGEVAEGPFLWGAYNFQGFFYDLKSDIKTETLNISYINGRTIPQGQIIYSTSPEEVSFIYSPFGKYQVIGFMAEKYFAGYTINTTPPQTRPTTNFSNLSTLSYGQLHKVLIDDDTKRTISVGGTIALQEGYVLYARDIDLNARMLNLSLLKDGTEVDGVSLLAGETYVYSKNISNVENLPLIMVRIDNVFTGPELKLAFLKGLFQLSENPNTIEVGNQFGKMNVTNVTNDVITMNNSMDINLDKNTNAVLMGNIKFKVADNDYLRYYPFVEYTEPGAYEVRGTVFNNPIQGQVIPSWNSTTFGGFYYDFKYNRFTEQLNFLVAPWRSIPEGGLQYITSKVDVQFKANEKEGVNVSGAGITHYQIVGWQGEKWIAIKNMTNKMAKLALEMGNEDKKTLTTGETWLLGAGYDLTVNDMDVNTSPRQVWFTLRKDGEIIDQAIAQAPVGNSISDKQKAVYYKTMTILGESDSLIFAVYVDSIFQGAYTNMVQFKYAWLMDGSSAKEIRASDTFGVFEVRQSDADRISLSNLNSIILSRNTEQPLLGDLKFKVADSDQLRLYLKKDFMIPNQSAPPINPSVLINNGDAYTSSNSVTLGISADNATEMSFSNDNINWSIWEPFSGTKSWKLSGNDGTKTVYFKARNAAGESSIACDTIILATPVRPKVNKVEIRGTVANEQDSPLLKPMWNASSFGAFMYDFKWDRSSETLTINEPLIYLNSTRTINKDILWYNTTKIPVNFKAYEREGVRVNGKSSYDIVGWSGEKFVGINGMSNKLARLVLEMGREDKKTLAVGETWGLGSGYELKVNEIDPLVYPRQVWFSLSRNGIIIDEGIGQAPASDTISDKEKAVYYKTMTIQGESDALLFTVYVDKIFAGTSSDIVQFKYGWLIDKDSTMEINAADRFGVFEVRTANSDVVMLSNEDIVILSSNTETTLMGNLKFRIADDSTYLRFFPYVEYTAPGTYEVRGSLYNTSLPATGAIPTWNASTFAGIYYDLNNDISTEQLNFLIQPRRTLPEGGLQYLTSKADVQFKANEKEGVNVSGVTQYQIVGWQGEKWVAIKNITNKIANLALEMGNEDKKTFTNGSNWSLGSGYEMTIDKIDARTTPRMVWFTLRKDGAIIDKGIGQAPQGSNTSEKQKAVYFKTRTILGESDSLLFTVYVDTIFSGANSDMVQFKYAWLIDEGSAKEIKAADTFGVFEVREADSDYIIMTNKKWVSLSANTETTLIGEIKFRVADDYRFLRFYPKVDREIGGTDLPPYSLSILIDHGEAYARSINVTLSLSAIDATEMSFSNDGSSWSPWESYTTSKSWILAEGEGLKTVHFKARNSYGEAAVTDTIFLKTIPTTKLVEIRGTAVNEPQTPDLMPSWDARDFAGLLYDFKYDRLTESLKITQDLRTLNGSRVIGKDMLRYETGKVPYDFIVYQNEGVLVAGMSYYEVVGWRGEKYVAIKGVANKVAKLTLEMGKDDKKTLTTGENWSLGEGYELIINAIDARTTPRQVWFTLKKDGAIVDEGIGQAPVSQSIPDKQKAVYYKTKTIQGESDALLLTMYVDAIFQGAESDMVQFKYAWLIDEDSAKTINAGDIIDVFQVRSADQYHINLTNEIPVNLSRNTVSTILGKIKIKVADSEQLRFYPFVTYTTQGTYEVRGTVANDPYSIPSWDAASFAGLYFDLNSNIKTETLYLTAPLYYFHRIISNDGLWYNTTKAPVDFKVFEKEGVLVNGARSYDVTGWQGEKYVAIKGVANKLARLVLEMGKEEEKTMVTGENWSLGSGYDLTVNAIDAKTSPRQVWFTLRKDGMIIDEAIRQSPMDNSTIEKQKAVYFKTMTIMGESNALLFTVYIDNIFSGQSSDIVRFKYAWLVDSDSAKEIRAGDIYDVFSVRMADSDSIYLSNGNSIPLLKNTETPIFGNITLKVADNDTVRFYPKVDYLITESALPPVPICGADKLKCENVGSPVQFNGSASYDPDGTIVSYAWEFGDGTTGTGAAPVHRYNTSRWNGTAYLPFTANLTVIDNNGLTNTTSQKVVIWIAGDANGDGKVNILDATLIGTHWKETPVNPRFSPCADLNNDNVIDILDATLVGKNWGRTP